MKNKILFSVLICLSLLGCDTDYDNDPTTICNAKFYSFQSQSEIATLSDTYNVGYLSKFNASSPSIFNNAIPNTSFNFVGTLFYPSSSLKNDNSLLVCLANKTGGKRLFTANLVTNSVIENGAISTDLSAPVFVNNDLRFLKITNKVAQITAPYNDVITCSVELVDESGVSFSGTPQIINFPANVENGFRDANIEAVYLNNKIYFLANCQLIIFDTTTALFSVQTIASYDAVNDKKFMQGLEISANNTLLIMKQTVTPSYKIEIIELASIASLNYSTTVKFNLQQSNFPANSPQLAAIINTSDRRSTTNDSCDNKYYFTYMSNYNPYSTEVYEVDLNALTITNYPFNNTFLFGLEVQK